MLDAGGIMNEIEGSGDVRFSLSDASGVVVVKCLALLSKRFKEINMMSLNSTGVTKWGKDIIHTVLDEGRIQAF